MSSPLLHRSVLPLVGTLAAGPLLSSSISNRQGPDGPWDAVSREVSFSAWNLGTEDAISREFSVGVGNQGGVQAISREVSFSAGNLGYLDAVSREFSVGVGNLGSWDAISREVSFSVPTEPSPDLAFDVTAVVLPDEGTTGQTFEVRWRVRNEGAMEAVGPWSDRISFSMPIPRPNGGPVTYQDSPGPDMLQPGAYYDRAVSFLMPAGPSSFTVTLTTDVGNQVVEYPGERNNTYGPHTVTVNDLPRPDLQVVFTSSPPFPPSPPSPPTTDFMPGDSVAFSFLVWNHGEAPTSVPHWDDTVYLVPADSTGQHPSGTTPAVASRSFPNLLPLQNDPNGDGGTPGTSYARIDETIVVPDTSEGTYYLAIRTDSGNAQPEVPGGEDDNLDWFGPISVVPALLPDLSLESLSLVGPPPIFPGVAVTLHWELRNEGPANFAGGGFTGRVWVSRDVVDSGPGALDLMENHELGPIAMESGPLSPGSSSTGSTDVFVPENLYALLESMAYSFKLLVDPDQEIPEDERTGGPPYYNNLRATELYPFNQPPTPDLRLQAIALAPGQGPPEAGHPMQVRLTVSNDFGLGGDIPITWRDEVWLSNGDGVLDGADYLLGTFQESNVFLDGRWIVPPQYDRTVTVWLDEDTEAGTYGLTLVLDTSDQVFERFPGDTIEGIPVDGETNNVGSSRDMQIGRHPANLVLEALEEMTMPPLEGFPGQSILLPWTVTNDPMATGTTSAGSWTDRVYLSQSPTSLLNAMPILTRIHSGALAPGQSYSEVQSASVPAADPSQDWWLFFVTDVNGTVFEDDTSDNWAATQFDVTNDAIADLVVDSVAASERMRPGDPITVSFMVRNAGTAGTLASSWSDSVMLSAVQDPTPGDPTIALGAAGRTQLLPEDSFYVATRTFDLPLGISPGFWFVVVDADASHQVFELDDGNNRDWTRTFIEVLPPAPPGEADGPSWLPTNIAARNVQILNSPITAGQEVHVGWEVTNDGPYPTSANGWADSLYLSLDAALDSGDYYLGYYQHTSFLDASAVRSVDAMFTVPSWAIGNWFVIVHTNSNGEVLQPEGAELDDLAASTQPLEVQLPPLTDLYVTDVAPPANARLGEKLLFDWTVANSGGSDVHPDWSWQDQFWLVPGQSAFPSVDARFLWQVPTSASGIPAGGMHTQTSNTLGGPPVVPGLQPGVYRLVAVADVLGQIAELDESNNVYDDLTGATIMLEADELPLEELVVPDLGMGDSRWFRLHGSGGGPPSADLTIDLELTHHDQTASCELFARAQLVPNLGLFDYSSEGASALHPHEQSLRIPRTNGGEYYVMARCPSGPTRGQCDLMAHVREFSVEAVRPPAVGAGRVTLAVEGSELWRASRMFLRGPMVADPPPEPVVIEAEEPPRWLEDGSLLARFDLHSAMLGEYEVVAVDEAGAGMPQVSWNELLRVEAPRALALTAALDASPSVRLGEVGRATLTLTNSGNVDLEYALASVGHARYAGAQDPTERVVFASEELGLDEIETDGTRDSLAILVEDLHPGESQLTELQFAVGSSFDPQGDALAVACVPATGLDLLDGWFSAQAEGLRVALAGDPTTPSELSAYVADPQAWQDLVMQALGNHFIEIDRTTIHLPDTLASSGRWLTQAIADGVAFQLPLPAGHEVPASAVELASASAACTLFTGTQFDCETLFPGGCGGEMAQVSVHSQRGDNVPTGRICIGTPMPHDPNEKLAPRGSGPQQLVQGDKPLVYEVHFENQESATAWASRIELRDELEPVLNAASVRFLELRVGENRFTFPPNASSFQGQIPIVVGDDVPLQCQISAGVNALNRTAFLILQAVDPVTGMPTQGGNIGLLAPSEVGHTREATGYLTFGVKPDMSGSPGPPPVLSGRRVQNQTHITFNASPPLGTNITDNTLDGRAPQSTLSYLPPVEGRISLSWAATDIEPLRYGDFPGSGVDAYSVYVSESAAGPWESVATDTQLTSADFQGVPGRTYHFKVEAKDVVGNVEAKDRGEITVAIPADCNENGTPDSNDIDSGTSADCNGNGIPDECEIADGSEQDCDGDGVLDSCAMQQGVASDVNRNDVLDTCECYWSTYCDAAPNSTGAPARIGAAGTASLSHGSLRLEAHSAPENVPAYFLFGTEAAQVPFGDGTLCVGGSESRLFPIVLTGESGKIFRAIDLAGPPFDAGPGMLEPGSTAYFQLWYRDDAAAGRGFNLSDGLAVTVCD